MDNPIKAKVTHMTKGGNFVKTEEWTVPTLDDILQGGGTSADLHNPRCMIYSPDFKRVGSGPIFVHSTSFWGQPNLIPAPESEHKTVRSMVWLMDMVEKVLDATPPVFDGESEQDRLTRSVRESQAKRR